MEVEAPPAPVFQTFERTGWWTPDGVEWWVLHDMQVECGRDPTSGWFCFYIVETWARWEEGTITVLDPLGRELPTELQLQPDHPWYGRGLL